MAHVRTWTVSLLLSNCNANLNLRRLRYLETLRDHEIGDDGEIALHTSASVSLMVSGYQVL